MALDLFEIILSGFIGAALPVVFGGIGFYLSKNRTKKRNTKLLIYEIKSILNILSNSNNKHKDKYKNHTIDFVTVHFASTVYDSVSSAGQITYYNDDITELIRTFYTNLQNHNNAMEKLDNTYSQMVLSDKIDIETTEKILLPYQQLLTALDSRLKSDAEKLCSKLEEL